MHIIYVHSSSQRVKNLPGRLGTYQSYADKSGSYLNLGDRWVVSYFKMVLLHIPSWSSILDDAPASVSWVLGLHVLSCLAKEGIFLRFCSFLSTKISKETISNGFSDYVYYKFKDKFWFW